VRCEMSLRDSFHFPLCHSSTCNSLAEARSTCDDIVNSAPSCPRLSVSAPTSNIPDFDNDMVPPQLAAVSPLPNWVTRDIPFDSLTPPLDRLPPSPQTQRSRWIAVPPYQGEEAKRAASTMLTTRNGQSRTITIQSQFLPVPKVLLGTSVSYGQALGASMDRHLEGRQGVSPTPDFDDDTAASQ